MSGCRGHNLLPILSTRQKFSQGKPTAFISCLCILCWCPWINREKGNTFTFIVHFCTSINNIFLEVLIIDAAILIIVLINALVLLSLCAYLLYPFNTENSNLP